MKRKTQSSPSTTMMYHYYSSRSIHQQIIGRRIFFFLSMMMMIVNPTSSFSIIGRRLREITTRTRSPSFLKVDGQSSSSSTSTSIEKKSYTLNGNEEQENNNNNNNKNIDVIVSDLEEESSTPTITATNEGEEQNSEVMEGFYNYADVDDADNNDETELLVSDISPLAPPLTFQKFITMQNKRVPVLIRYSGESGMKPYFLTMAKKIKEKHPDVILNKVILAKEEGGGGGEGDNVSPTPTFEVLVDGKVVIRGPSGNRSGRSKSSGTMSIFVSSEELDLAISRARKRRRPATVYGEDGKNVRLETLRKTKGNAHAHSRD